MVNSGFTLSRQLQVRSLLLVVATLNFRTEKTKGLSEDRKKLQGIKQSKGKCSFLQRSGQWSTFASQQQMQGSRESVVEARWGPWGKHGPCMVSSGVAAASAAPGWGQADCFVWSELAG